MVKVIHVVGLSLSLAPGMPASAGELSLTACWCGRRCLLHRLRPLTLLWYVTCSVTVKVPVRAGHIAVGVVGSQSFNEPC